jgi:hypothetical protein
MTVSAAAAFISRRLSRSRFALALSMFVPARHRGNSRDCAAGRGKLGGFAMGEWKPIKTVPKDGTRILLLATAEIHGEQPAPVVGYWSKDHGGRWVEGKPPRRRSIGLLKL